MDMSPKTTATIAEATGRQARPSDPPPILTLSDKAVAHIRSLLAKKTTNDQDSAIIGIRVGIKTAGCSGMKYHVEYATEAKPFEERVTAQGVTVFIDPKAVMFLLGSQMDWHEDVFASGFVFHNPNEVARCGCGESFSVTPNAFQNSDATGCLDGGESKNKNALPTNDASQVAG